MRKFFYYLMGVFYILAGFNHFLHPRFYQSMMPGFLPRHAELIILTGVCEILFAVFLLLPLTRRIGAWLLILLLITVFPANIHQAVIYYQQQDPYLWMVFLRLPLQGILIIWAWLYTWPEPFTKRISKVSVYDSFI